MNNKKKILLIDDDKFLLDMYCVRFANEGHEPSGAVGGAQALKLLREGFVPDIILFDIVMPIMDGHKFLETVKKEGLAKDAVFIMLTNQGQSYDIERAQKLGANGYIIKASTIPSEVVAEALRIYKQNKK